MKIRSSSLRIPFKFDETAVALSFAVALSLLCALPIDVVERAMVDNNKEVMLILAKALDLSWATTMSLLFLGAANYRITAGDLDRMKREFARLNVETSKKVLEVYQSRKETAAEGSIRRLPQLHANEISVSVGFKLCAVIISVVEAE